MILRLSILILTCPVVNLMSMKSYSLFQTQLWSNWVLPDTSLSCTSLNAIRHILPCLAWIVRCVTLSGYAWLLLIFLCDTRPHMQASPTYAIVKCMSRSVALQVAQWRARCVISRRFDHSLLWTLTNCERLNWSRSQICAHSKLRKSNRHAMVEPPCSPPRMGLDTSSSSLLYKSFSCFSFVESISSQVNLIDASRQGCSTIARWQFGETRTETFVR